MPPKTIPAAFDHLPAKDVFLAEVFTAVDSSPAAEVARLVDVELRRKEALADLALVWTANGHTFDTANFPETQRERAGRHGWCVACGYLIHARGEIRPRGAAPCSPAGIGLR